MDLVPIVPSEKLGSICLDAHRTKAVTAAGEAWAELSHQAVLGTEAVSAPFSSAVGSVAPERETCHGESAGKKPATNIWT